MSSFCMPRPTFARARRLATLAGAVFFFAGGALAQQISCALTALSTPTVHVEGLSERVGDLTISCSGGTAGATASLSVLITLNTAITNRLDPSGAPQGLTVTLNGATLLTPPQLVSSTTILLNNVNYTVPPVPATNFIIGVSGLRAAAASLSNGTGTPTITATVNGLGAQFTTNGQNTVALTAPTLLASIFNVGIPCAGSTLPANQDFTSFAQATSASIVRVTEASGGAFTTKEATADTGYRVIVRLSGYSPTSRIFVPDVIVGSDGTSPTSTGSLNSVLSPGSYTLGAKQLLFSRVAGADANGSGGALLLNNPNTQIYSSVSEISLTGGAGYVVYEVLDSNVNLQETAQIPLFVVNPAVSCTAAPAVPSLSVSSAPVSTVAIASSDGPIPRFLQLTPAADCTTLGDCSAPYFPNFSVDTSSVTLNGTSLGPKQVATVGVSNTGTGTINFNTSITYVTGGNSSWLSVNPASGQNSKTLQLTADPSSLQPGAYSAILAINAGTYGVFNVTVNFTVGQPGITIQNVLNAASGASLIVPGSYTALYGLNLSGQNVAVTFAGIPATIVFVSSSQINLIVPASLSTALADVIVTADGRTSNRFTVTTALNQPGIFNPGIVNSDGSVNTSISPVTRGSFVAIYLTGLTVPLTGPLTVNIGGATNLTPIYAGAQGTLPALDQVNVTVPASLPATPNPVPVTICIPGQAGQPVCSNAVNLYIK